MISVIIPTYKPGPYLARCLESLKNQSYTDFEVLLILNGCAEPWLLETQNLVKQYNDLKIILLHTEQVGVSNARNWGIDASQGDWICFLDDDDWLSNCALEEMVGLNSSDSIVCCNVICVDENGDESIDYLGKSFIYNKQKKTTLMSARSFLSTSCCKLISRQLIGDCRFDPQFCIGEDSLFMAALSPKIKQINFTQENAIYYRFLRNGSASRGLERKKSWQLARAFIKIWKANPLHCNPMFFMSRIVASLL